MFFNEPRGNQTIFYAMYIDVRFIVLCFKKSMRTFAMFNCVESSSRTFFAKLSYILDNIQ